MRKTRIAISPRLATSTFENSGTPVFSRSVGLADQPLTLARIAAVPVVLLLVELDFEATTTGRRPCSPWRWRPTGSTGASHAAAAGRQSRLSARPIADKVIVLWLRFALVRAA